MKNLFEHTGAPWIRYSSYEYKAGSDSNLYITVSKDAKPEMHHPMQEAGQFFIDAINVGLAAMHKVPEEELKESVLCFIKKYGFLGFMSTLPTTADFITYESVYLPKNHFIKEESLPTENYLAFYQMSEEQVRNIITEWKDMNKFQRIRQLDNQSYKNDEIGNPILISTFLYKLNKVIYNESK